MNDLLKEVVEVLESYVRASDSMLDENYKKYKAHECSFRHKCVLTDKDWGFLSKQQKEVDKYSQRSFAYQTALNSVNELIEKYKKEKSRANDSIQELQKIITLIIPQGVENENY